MSNGRWFWIVVLAALMLSGAGPVSADTGDISLFGHDLTVEAGQHSRGNAAVVAGSAVIEEGGTLSGDLAVIGGNARIGGTVEGDVVVIGGALELEDSARLLGDVVAMGTLNRHPEAVVLGNVVAGAEASGRVAELGNVLRGDTGALRPQGQTRETSTFMRGLVSVLRFVGSLLAWLIVGAMAVSLIPGSMEHISDVMKHSPVLSVAMGLLTFLAAVILVPLLTIIIVGIPVVLVLVVALVLGAVVGWIAAALLLGARLLKGGTHSKVEQVLLGIVILTLMGRVPCVGWLATLAAVTWGLGAVVLTRFGTSGQRIWEPFASLAGIDPSASSPPSAAAVPNVDLTQPGAASQDANDKLEKKDDTRPLKDLDEDLAQYTKD
ncbi:MAG: polymer-forming cytoskeletal protein [Anaerolineae bacterium]